MPFELTKGEVKAVAVMNNEKGAIVSEVLAIAKQQWKIVKNDSESEKHKASLAIDDNRQTFWQSKEATQGHFIIVDLGKDYILNAFAYTPQKESNKGMMAKGMIEVSNDGTNWQTAGSFEFGNLVNDPTTRKYVFESPVAAHYVWVTATEIAANDKTLAIAELDFFER